MDGAMPGQEKDMKQAQQPHHFQQDAPYVEPLAPVQQQPQAAQGGGYYQSQQQDQYQSPPPLEEQGQHQQQNQQGPNDGVQMYDASAPVPIRHLRPQSQTIECPNCNQVAQTKCEVTGTKWHGWLNFCCWPLPNRKHWLDVNHWYCQNCKVEVARQKYNKEVVVLVGPNADVSEKK